jgi:flagellar motor switch protein FliM
MSAATQAFDFRADRVTEPQLRLIQAMHEEFARRLGSSLATYLRNASPVTFTSLEPQSYAEFSASFASPTCLAYIGVHPGEETAVMEISPAIVFTMLEVLMGGTAKEPANLERKLTEIEKGVVQNALRIVSAELHAAWKNIGDIRFGFELLTSEVQPNRDPDEHEAMLVTNFDMTIGPVTGPIRIALPVSLIKRFKHKFEQTRAVRKPALNEHDRAKIARLISGAELTLEARLDPTKILATDLVDLEIGDVLMLDHALDRPLTATLNGQPVYAGQIITLGDKVFLKVTELSPIGTKNKFLPPAAI